MSAYSDWRCGAISDEEYKTAYNHERGEDHGIIDDLPFTYEIKEEEDNEQYTF